MDSEGRRDLSKGPPGLLGRPPGAQSGSPGSSTVRSPLDDAADKAAREAAKASRLAEAAEASRLWALAAEEEVRRLQKEASQTGFEDRLGEWNRGGTSVSSASSLPGAGGGAGKKPKADAYAEHDFRYPGDMSLADRFDMAGKEILLGCDKLTSVKKQYIADKLAAMSGIFQRYVSEVAYLRGIVDGRSSVSTELQKLTETVSSAVPSGPVRSFADAARRSVASSGGVKVVPSLPERGAPPTLFIKPAEGTRDTEVLKNEFRSSLDPRAEGLWLRSVSSAGPNRVAVDAGDWKTVERIKQSATLKSKGLQVSEESRFSPKVIVYDVDSSLEPEDFVDSVFEQNFNGEFEKEDFKKGF